MHLFFPGTANDMANTAEEQRFSLGVLPLSPGNNLMAQERAPPCNMQRQRMLGRGPV